MRSRIALVVALAALGLLTACGGVDFVARPETKVTVSANPTAIASTGATARITAVLITNAGLPVPDKTVVRFTTTLGTVTGPAETKDGIAYSTLTSNGSTGAATVTAFSGGVSGTFEVTIGVVASAISLAATPASLATGGGTVQLTATVFGDSGAPVEGASVAFSSTQGSLASSGVPIITDASGVAIDRLTASQTAEVTATAGVKTATITVPVGATSVTDVVLSAKPVNLPSTGGSVALVAVALGESGPVPGVAVAWSATNGSLGTAGVTLTDVDGKATNSLATTVASIVTANAAGKSDSVTITVGSSPTVTISVAASRSSIPLMDQTGIDYCTAPSSSPALPIDVSAQMQDEFGLPVAGREVQFFVDFFYIGSCGIAFGEFCGSPGSAVVTATTDSRGIATVKYTITDADIEACNCLPPTCSATAPVGKCTSAPAGCGALCVLSPPENQFCQIGISAISGGVLSTNGVSIEYGR